MTVFRYRVFDRSGKISVRRVDAVDRRAAEARLREEGCTILKALSGVGGGALAKLAIRRRGKFDLCDFTGKLLPLLQAHVQLPKALRIIGEGTGNPAEREVVEALSRGLREGRKFSALLRESGKFPPLYWSLCEVGEETGNLTGVVAELYGFLARSKATREFLITSSIYPAILVTVTILVVLAVFIFFLPYFAGIFTDMGRELPSAARALLSISDAITSYWWLWAFVIVGAAWYLNYCRKTPEKNLKLEALLLKLPAIGALRVNIEMSRFFRTLAILFASNVQVMTSIRIAVNTLESPNLRRSLADLAAELRGGGRLSEGLKASRFVEREAVQLVEVGEESGELGGMLGKVADRYAAKVDVSVKRLLALFEPAVIAVLALVILAVVLTVFMTILEMNEF